MPDTSDDAKQALEQLFKRVYEFSGLEWNAELGTMVDDIVTDIIQAALNEAHRYRDY